ncbi:MAG: glutamate--tRNA ligase [Deltaproteobacteria bacterium]|nr:glutamate--tRNA ligase [Deltaproteobacteria bacterium]
MSEVRTRFAPSPTGYPHIGGMRTAFYAWLLAKHYNGKFLLRIEDTDQERLVRGAIKQIVEGLAWFGVIPDEAPSNKELSEIGESWDGAPDIGGQYGPYIQSLRLPRYKEVAQQLIDSGHAYRCDCTPEMLERERNEQMARKELPGYSGYCRTRNVSAEKPHVVRFKMPAKVSLVLQDAVRGRVAWDNIPLRDSVLLKSDGFPTYHLAVVVDDHDMKISHVLRGEEWLPTTPLHLLLYEALQWEKPIFAHLPQVLGPDGKKLSKRHGATAYDAFRDDGYLPEALFNFVVLIGWSPGEGEEQEVFKIEEICRRFTLEHVNKAGGVFDYNKLAWMNGVYIRSLQPDDFVARVTPFLEKAGLKVDPQRFGAIAPHVQERIKLLTEAAPMVEFLFVDKIERDMQQMFKKDIDRAKARQILTLSLERLTKLEAFEIAPIEGVLRPLAEELGLKVGPMFGVLRIAVTGKTITPPLFESFAALGREKTLSRIEETVKLLE